MALEQCNEAIAAAIGRELTDRERRIVSARAGELKRRIDRANGDPVAVTGIMNDFADEVEKNKALIKRTAALNYLAYSKVKGWRQSVQFVKDNPAEAFKAFMRGSLFNFEGSKRSLANLVQREQTSRVETLFADLAKNGLHDYAFSGDDDANINRAWSELKDGLTPSAAQYGANAVKVAQIFDQHLEGLRLDQNKAGAFIGRASDRTFRRSHDANKIAKAGGNDFGSDAAKNAWVDFVTQRLNWERSFEGHFADVSNDARRTILGDLWKDFAANDHWKPGQSHPPVGLGTANYAKRLSHSRQLLFNSPDDELTYFKQFGTGNSIAENVYHNLRGGGRDLALMRQLGPNPEATLNKIVNDWRDDIKENGTVQQLEDFKKMVADERGNTWRLLTEGAGHPADNFVGRFFGAIRGLTNTAAIGMSIFSMPGDMALRARMIAKVAGDSFSKTILSTTARQVLGQGLSAVERKQLFAEIGLRTEAANLPLDPDLVDHAGFGAIAKFNQQVAKLGGHSFWDNRMRLNSLVADGYRHWTFKDRAFDELPEGTQAAFQQFGITSDGWDILRQSEGTRLENGVHVFMPSDIKEMPLERFKSLVASERPSDAQLTRARNDLADNYRNLMGELADRSVSAPSIANQAFARMGEQTFQAGTLKGELWRGALQLKGWALNYMRNHLGDELLGYNTTHKTMGQAIKDVVTGQNNKALWGISRLVASGMVIASVTNMLRDLATGEEPEDPLSEHALKRALARQSLGLYTDFLLQDTRPDASIWERIGRMAGPEIGFATDMANSAIRLIAQHESSDGVTPEKLGRDMKDWFQTIYRATPGTSLFWSKWAMDYLIRDNISEMLNPGYKQRLEQQREKNGRTMLFGASAAAGGGFR